MMWSTFGASRQGGTHIQLNLPCQDASLCREGKGYFIAAAADGHGSRKHFRSGKGAEVACKVACDCLEVFSQRISPKKIPAEEEIRLLKEQILQEWKFSVKQDVEQHPWTTAELEEQADLLKSSEYNELVNRRKIWIPYGTTITAVLVTADFWLAVQLGDGDMVTISPKGKFCWPMPESEVNNGHFTASLCMANPMPEFRHCMDDQFPAAFLAYTDGIEKSFSTRGKKLLEYLYAIWGVVYAGKVDEVQKALAAATQLGPFKDDATIVGIIDDAMKIDRPAFAELQRMEQLTHINAQINEAYSTMEYNQVRLQQMSRETTDEEQAAMEMEQIILYCGHQIDALELKAKELMQGKPGTETEMKVSRADEAISDLDEAALKTVSVAEGTIDDTEKTAQLFVCDDPQLTWSTPPKNLGGEIGDPDNN